MTEPTNAELAGHLEDARNCLIQSHGLHPESWARVWESLSLAATRLRSVEATSAPEIGVWDVVIDAGTVRALRDGAAGEYRRGIEDAAKVCEEIGDEILEFWERPGGPPGNGYRKTKASDFVTFIRKLAP